MLKLVPARSERTRQTFGISATATKRFARAVVVTTPRSAFPTGTATAYSREAGSSSKKRTRGSAPSSCFHASGPGAWRRGETYWENCCALPNCRAMDPQIPPGASVLRPLKPMTRQAGREGAGFFSAKTVRRSSGSRARSPRAIMLCVLPPPMACERRKTEEPTAEPPMCLKARSTKVSMPLVK